MNVQHILERKGDKPITLGLEATVADAVATLYQYNIGALVIVDDAGAVKGIISERDIVRRLHDSGDSVLTHPVAACMTAQPFCCEPATTVDQVMQIMTNRRIRHVPVIDRNALIGVISIGDVVKRKIEEAESEAEALREYIAS